jgi:probable F420-dependent oxidoreductase
MKFGVVFPQYEYGSDPAALRDFAQTAEQIGYSHVIAYDHVLGANPDRPGGWKGPYTYETLFMEPFVLFSYMAAITQGLGFMTGILIMPQRQTALVAKQAATLDVLCNGRFRLGVGLGWNEVEYTALNQDFHSRGKRLEEQIGLLRQLWTQPLVKFQGAWDTIPDAGINPLPVQRPIPIWIGGSTEAALRRAARIADGWLPNSRTFEDGQKGVAVIRREMEAIGRDPSSLAIEPRLVFGDGNPAPLLRQIQDWQEIGITQFSINTIGSRFTSPKAHLEALEAFAKNVDISPR